ncbi:hypothetical protein J2Z32_003446 [Paenibacillus turicensis]|uniref:Uncharacterized protein n=2 Tax=Paenibacillus turicensis TaxID=160487 RepID=A0ABS4FW16_9BACL|nr:hypothetical protein [Paenibacillus turicensis]
MTYWTRFIISMVLVGSFYVFNKYLEIPTIGSFFIALAGGMLVFIPNFYVMGFSSDLKKIEKALTSNRSVPIFNLYLALGSRDDEKVDICVEALLNKYKLPSRQALFKTIHAMYKEEILTVKEEIKLIKPQTYQYYYEALLCIEEFNITSAEKYIDMIDKPWMKLVLLSTLKLRLGDDLEAYQLSLQALEQSKGIQKYAIYKSMEKEFPQFMLHNQQVV